MLYERIKELCAERAISIYRLEKDLGFATSSILKWQTSSPSVEKVQKVAEYLGVSISSLLEEPLNAQKDERDKQS